MATYDAQLHLNAFENMERGVKTVYTVLASDEYSVMCAGDRLEFGSFGSITLGTVRRYADLEALVAVEGWRNLVPGAETLEEALEQIRANSDWNVDKEREKGVMALRVRETRRK